MASRYVEDLIKVFVSLAIVLAVTRVAGRFVIGVYAFDYSGYPSYPQLWGGDFQNNVSIVDLLFNCGRDAGRYMKHVAR